MFQYQPYSPAYTGSIAELLQAGPRAQAAAIRARGQGTANTIAGAGQAVAGTIGGILQNRLDAPKREMEQLQLGQARTAAALQEQATAASKDFSQWVQSRPTPPTPQEIVGRYGPELGARFATILKSFQPDLMAVPEGSTVLDKNNPGTPVFTAPKKAPEPYTLGPGQQRFGPNNQSLASVPAEVKAPSTVDAALFAAYQKNDTSEVQRLLALKKQEADATRAPSVRDATVEAEDDMVKHAAQNILHNPRDLTSIRTITSLRGDQRLKLFNELKRIDPNFNVGNIDRQVKFLDSYEDPKGLPARNRSSMNNIIMHAADLSAVNEQYRRSDMRLVNTPIAAIEKQQGTAWSRFMVPMSVLKDEISLYFAGGYAPNVDQQKTWDRIVNDTATPAQVEQFAKDIIHIGLRRADTHNEQFKTMMGYDDPNLITPTAVQAATTLGLGDAVKKYGSGGQFGTRAGGQAGTAAPLRQAIPGHPGSFAISTDGGKTWKAE